MGWGAAAAGAVIAGAGSASAGSTSSKQKLLKGGSGGGGGGSGGDGGGGGGGGDDKKKKKKDSTTWQDAGGALNKAIDGRYDDHARQDRIENQKERLLSLRPFLAVAGTSLLDVQEDEESDRLKMNNLTMGQTPYNPLGILDNKLALSQMATDGLRYGGDTFVMPMLYSGGTLTNGATLYGSMIDAPRSIDTTLFTPVPGGNKRRRIV